MGQCTAANQTMMGHSLTWCKVVSPWDKQWDYTNPWQLRNRQSSGCPLQISLRMSFWLLSTPSHFSCSTHAVGRVEQEAQRGQAVPWPLGERGSGGRGGHSPSPGMCTMDPSSSARQSCFDVQALFLGTRCHMKEGTVLFLSPACQTTTERMTINLKA